MSARYKSLALPIVVLLVLVLLVVIPQLQKSSDVHDAGEQVFVDACSLVAEPCDIALGHEHVTFEFSPKGLPVMQSLQLTISNTANERPLPEILGIWFEGRSMDMGSHYLLPQALQPDSTAVFAGVIPVCTSNPEMVWQMVAELLLHKKRYRVTFVLDRKQAE